MKNNYRHVLKLFLLFAFVSLMLCPHAEIITASHGGKILIQQDDFKKNRKLVKNECQPPQTPAFLKTPLPDSARFWSEVRWPLFSLLCPPIGLSLTTTVQLLL